LKVERLRSETSFPPIEWSIPSAQSLHKKEPVDCRN
jgi:hypothetical protein